MVSDRLSWRQALLLAAAAGAAFFPVFFASFLNWDDPAHITANAAVLNFNLKDMFFATVQGTYIPLTTLSFAVEKAIFGLNPAMIHLDNLLLHVGVAGLLFGLFVRLGAPPRASVLAALLFAIHPMRVESVAWATERKDVLYAVFYVVALRQWWAYLAERRPSRYALTLLGGLLSLLSKPMAVSLPLTLALLEWWKEGSFRRVRWPAYVPFVVMAAALGAVTYVNFARDPVVDPVVSGLLWIWSLAFYLWKFAFPAVLQPVYSVPAAVGIMEPPYLLSLVLVAALAAWLVHVARTHRDRWLLLAAGLFFLQIFFLLRFDAFGVHVVADRFMYLPSAGICLWLGIRADQAWSRHGHGALAVITAVGLLLAVRTFTYARVWHDSVTLWTHALAYDPDNEMALSNRALAYVREGRYDLAARDHERLIARSPRHARWHFERALTYRDWAKAAREAGNTALALELTDKAGNALDEAIRLKSDYARAYAQRGVLRFRMGDKSGALEDLGRAIALDPRDLEVYNNRGNVRAASGQLDLALEDYRKVLQDKDFAPSAYSNIGIIYARRGLWDLALQSFEAALRIDPADQEAAHNRDQVLKQKRNSH